jgi:glycine oxidase
MTRDVMIVGGGLVGCLTAMALTKQGIKVTLLERGVLGAEASWAGGGILFPLLPWHYSEAVNQLALAGAALYPSLAQELIDVTGIDPEYTVSGMRVLPNFDKVVAQRWCKVHEIKAEFHGDELWLPQVAQVRNPRLIKALRRWLEINAVELREGTEMVALKAHTDQISALQTQSGELLQADQYVVTAGAWSKKLLGPFALDIELKPMRGQMLLFKLAPGILQEILYSDDFYLIPRQDGHILAGSTLEDVGYDKSTTPQAAADLYHKAVKLLPVLANETPINHWSGLRPGSPDNIPVVARHPALQNLWLNTGHFRYGVTMAPASANMLANSMQMHFVSH